MSEWISVKEKEPDNRQEVIFYSGDVEMVCAGIYKGGIFYDHLCIKSGKPEREIGVTHWMPLPPPPEQESE